VTIILLIVSISHCCMVLLFCNCCWKSIRMNMTIFSM